MQNLWWTLNLKAITEIETLKLPSQKYYIIPKLQTPILGHGANYTRFVPGPRLGH